MAKQLLTPIRRQAPRYQMLGIGGHPMKAASYDGELHIQGEIGELLLDKLRCLINNYSINFSKYLIIVLQKR